MPTRALVRSRSSNKLTSVSENATSSVFCSRTSVKRCGRHDRGKWRNRGRGKPVTTPAAQSSNASSRRSLVIIPPTFPCPLFTTTATTRAPAMETRLSEPAVSNTLASSGFHARLITRDSFAWCDIVQIHLHGVGQGERGGARRIKDLDGRLQVLHPTHRTARAREQAMSYSAELTSQHFTVESAEPEARTFPEPVDNSKKRGGNEGSASDSWQQQPPTRHHHHHGIISHIHRPTVVGVPVERNDRHCVRPGSKLVLALLLSLLLSLLSASRRLLAA